MVIQTEAALRFDLCPVKALGPAERARLFALMAAHYDAVSPERFAADLAWKHAVGLLRDSDGVIQGFSTLVLNPGNCGRPGELVLYSGDTIVARDHWGTQELVRGFCETAGRISATWPKRRLLWYLLSKGHRTYMYLPLFAERYLPAADPARHATELEARAASISRRLFGADWDARRGVIAFAESLGELKPEMAAATWQRRSNAHVNFFLKRNPHFADGQELVCMTELSVANMRRIARRYFEIGLAAPFNAGERACWGLDPMPSTATTTGLRTARLQPALRTFEAAAREPAAVQESLLLELARTNQQTAFGRRYDFASIRDRHDWRRLVPLQAYSQLLPWIDRLRMGERGVLTHTEPDSLTPTSGSSGAAKLLPFTAPFAAAVGRAASAWLAALTEAFPGVARGPAYWVVSPPFTPTGTAAASAVPVRLPLDLAYFSPPQQDDLAAWLVTPPAADCDPDAWYRETIATLLKTRDLAMVSVWSPTAFLVLDRHLRAATGTDSTWRDLWPRLTLLSCWTDGESARWLPAVRQRLGDVSIQGKGLLATEGVTSIPLPGGDPVLALTAHVYEFRDADGRLYWPEELRQGQDYTVIISTQAGLYRYCTGDQVQVTGWYTPGLPRLRFIGRAGGWSDLVGEKLAPAAAAAALAAAPEAEWAMLVAMADGPAGPGYLLATGPGAGPATVRRVRDCLRTNPYYAQAESVRQLAPLAWRPFPDLTLPALLAHLARARGCREGDVKLPALCRDTTLLELLEATTSC